MNPDDLARILDELGKRLGPTGEYVFALAVRQVYIDALVAFVALVLWAIVTAVAARPMYRWVQGNSTYGSRDLIGGLAAMGWAGLGCLLVLLAFLAIPAVLNPEYAALRDILSAIGGAR